MALNFFKTIKLFEWQRFHDFDNPEKDDPNSGLAYQDAFIRYLPQINQAQPNQPQAILHYYPYNQKAVLLGGKDTRLPQLQAGINYLESLGYRVVVRPHGGLAVVNDPQVLNIAMVLDKDYIDLTIDNAYQLMIDLVQVSLNLQGYAHIKIEAYEIVDSYCPGKFDIVVAGQKIGGIAQRRFRSGTTVAAYISVGGNQDQRSLDIKEFYARSQADLSYPQVNLNSMTSLSQVLGLDISLAQYTAWLDQIFQSKVNLTTGNFNHPSLEEIYQYRYQQALKRNQLG